MKIEPRRIAAFLAAPGPVRAVLLHGDDTGLIRDRAARLLRAVAGGADDPFLTATLERGAHSRLREEASAMALVGGRRVVRVRDATDALLPDLQAALAAPGDALLVLEGPDQTAKSKLRAHCERAADIAVVACYPQEGQALSQSIREILTDAGVQADAEVLAYLAQNLGADRGVTESEMAKVVTQAGSARRLTLADVEASVGDAGAGSVDEALHAATAGDFPGADRALTLAFAEGGAAVGILRQALSHLLRLHRARLAMAGGLSAEDAAKSLRPAPFFRRLPAFAAALRAWSPAALARAADAATQAERDCKRTGAPDEAVCREFLLSLARYAKGRQGRRTGA